MQMSVCEADQSNLAGLALQQGGWRIFGGCSWEFGAPQRLLSLRRSILEIGLSVVAL